MDSKVLFQIWLVKNNNVDQNIKTMLCNFNKTIL